MVFIMSRDIRISLKGIYRILEKQEKTRLTINGREYIIKIDMKRSRRDVEYIHLFDETLGRNVAYVCCGACFGSEPLEEQIDKHLYTFVFGYRTHEPFQNKGIMTGFVKQITETLLQHFNSIVLVIEATNIYSEKVAINNGYIKLVDRQYPTYIKEKNIKEINNEKL